MKPHIIRYREFLEIVVILGVAGGVLWASRQWGAGWHSGLAWVVVCAAALKTTYYFAESLWHLVEATALDLPYHRFLVLMGYNMIEVTLSFAVDFYCLEVLDRSSLSGIADDLSGGMLFFECIYFSVLNFSFFGYGDITPAHMTSKLVMLMEVITAFTTVIFLISDFVSMKESMRLRGRGPAESLGGGERDALPVEAD